MNVSIALINSLKNDAHVVFSVFCLRFINSLNRIIKTMRDCWDKFNCLQQLSFFVRSWKLDGVCTHNTEALIQAKAAAQNLQDSESNWDCFSLFFYGRIYACTFRN